MSKTIVKAVIALFFLSSFVVTRAQDQKATKQQRVLVPVISEYGSLRGLNDANGKKLLKDIPSPWNEGYAIVYQVKNANGVVEDRLVYVLGNQVSPMKPNVEKQKSTNSTKVITTADKVLEITRSIIWDGAANSLRSRIAIKNIGNAEAKLKAIEIIVDERVVAQLVGSGVRDLIQPQCPTPPSLFAASMGCMYGADCPQCLCDPRCQGKPGQAQAFVHDPMNPEPLQIPGFMDPMRILMSKLKAPVLCIFWADTNLPSSTLMPGAQLEGHYTVTISLQN